MRIYPYRATQVPASKWRNHAKNRKQRTAVFTAAIEVLEARRLLSVSVSTAAAGAITTTAATLNGVVNPHGVSATPSFQYGTNSDLTSTIASGVGTPTGVAVDSAGNVYAAIQDQGELLQIAPSGAIKTLFSQNGSSLQSVATDAAGDVFATGFSVGAILEFPSAGGAMKTIESQVVILEQVGVDSHGDLFFTAPPNGGSVEEIPAGSSTAKVLATGISSESIAVDAAGDVFVPNSAGTAVEEIPHTGSIKTVASGFGAITALAVDGSGDLFIADFNKNTISEVKPNQSPVVIRSNQPDVRGIAVSSTGKIFISDDQNNRVLQLTPSTIAAKPSPVTGSSNVAISAALSGIKPGTKIYYRAVVTTGGVTTLGSTTSFVTAVATAATSAATLITTSGATLHATVNGHGSSTTTQFQVSTSPTFATEVPSGFVATTSLAVDAAGNVIVYDTQTSSLKKIPPSGAITTIATGVPFPLDMTVDKLGNVFVAPNTDQSVILEYRPGKSVLTITSQFPANSVAVDGSDNVFVENAGGITEIPVSGPAKTLLSGRGGECVTIDAAGNLFYEDDVDQTVEELPHGSTIPQIVATGLGSLFGIAVDGNGDLFTTNPSTGVTEIPKGGVPVTIDTGHRMQVAANASGQVFVTDSSARVFNISPLTLAGAPATVTGTSNIVVSATVSGLKPKTTYYFRPVLKFNGLTMFGAVSTFKTAALPLPVVTTGAITSITSTGAALNATVNAEGQSSKTLFQYSTSSTFVPTVIANIGSGFSEPAGVAVESAGNVYVADDSNNAIYKIAPGGKPVAIGSGFNSPQGVAVDSAGDVFVADLGNNAVKEIFSNGAIITVGSGFNGPAGVAVDPAGDVFVADTSNSAINEVLPSGTIKILGSGFSFPSGVALDALGDVFVADGGNNSIKEIKTDGSVHLIRSGFSDPQGVAVDAAGDIFVGDSGHNAVTEILPSGSTLALGSGFMGPFGVTVDSVGDVFIGDQNDARVIELSHPTIASSTLTGSVTTAIKGTLTGLKSKTTYYYRAIATSAAGTTLGQIKSFTTP